MNMKLIKRILTVTLAGMLVVMPITAAAETDSSSPAATTTETAAEPASVAIPEATQVVTGGKVIKSAVAGASTVTSFKGVAVKANDSAIVAAGAAIAKGERAYVKSYDVTAKTSPAVYASFNGCAKALGGTVISAMNVDFGKMAGKKYSQLDPNVQVPVTVGIPGKVQAGKTYAMIKVLPGGATEVLADQDTDPNTVTFNIQGGLASYALVVY
ncbi:hypothetical protein [Butyrivibrio sp. INlla14]|uniref:hypothetical protein n=1 Tax=Butyrivibrio sp. INlla14 TaxID=1520808 RepID=UPI0008769B02|nr:hypothetical protein [Butyrivibrio sp. INlla14]SCY45730.1 hypothetical protein SAMN02910371_02379 [Butyrivibrio sp. INlla14]